MGDYFDKIKVTIIRGTCLGIDGRLSKGSVMGIG
jgi:hypothetical protein